MTAETVLVYGGDRQGRRSIQQTLTGAGYRVRLASSMAEAAKCLSGGEVRAIVLAGASAGPSDPADDRAEWRERGIPIIDVVNDSRSTHRSTIEIALLDVLRNARPSPPVSGGDPDAGATPR